MILTIILLTKNNIERQKQYCQTYIIKSNTKQNNPIASIYAYHKHILIKAQAKKNSNASQIYKCIIKNQTHNVYKKIHIYQNLSNKNYGIQIISFTFQSVSNVLFVWKPKILPYFANYQVFAILYNTNLLQMLSMAADDYNNLHTIIFHPSDVIF